MRILVFLVAWTTCAYAYSQTWQDLADVPPSLRQANWESQQGQGSCVHASIVTSLRWLNQDEVANWWKAAYSGGEYASRVMQRLDEAAIAYVATEEGDAAVLEYASRNRLVVVIPYKPAHCINLVDLNSQYAVLLDNNRTGEYEYVPREKFLSQWREQFGGFAVVIIGTPAPPWPAQ
jgi:hypothetical protein